MPRTAVASLLLVLLVSLGAGTTALHLSSLEERPIALSAPIAPGVLIAHFWATWCASCVEELPVLARAADRCDPGTVRVVAVNVGESLEVVEDYLRGHALKLEVLLDPRGKVWRDLSGDGLPLNLTWTAARRETSLGPRSEAEWLRVLGELGCDLGDPPATPASGSNRTPGA
jgi:thiol-disulfide isomerase/thioredoxin